MVPSIGLKQHPAHSHHFFIISKKQSVAVGPIISTTMSESSIPSHNLTPQPIKFLCSYGGRILPRFTDGKLRYHGGDTRVLSFDSSISFAELLVKMGEMCGSSVSLRCQLPTEDLDALVSITSDEDLANLIEEYNRSAAAPSSSFKIRAFLSAPKTIKKVSPPPSQPSFSSHASTPKSPFTLCSVGGGIPPRCPAAASRPYKRVSSRPPAYPVIRQKVAANIPDQLVYHYQIGQPRNGCGVGRLIHNGNHWQ